MNKTFKITLLICLLLFLILHYFVMSISKELFPAFSYITPFVPKFWFETGRFLLSFNIQMDLTLLFKGIRYLLLVIIAGILFSFKYQWAYKMTLWASIILLSIYLFTMLYLNLMIIYPIYTLGIIISLALSIYLLTKKSL